MSIRIDRNIYNHQTFFCSILGKSSCEARLPFFVPPIGREAAAARLLTRQLSSGMRGAMQHCPLCVMGAGRIVCDNDLSKLFNFHKLWVELPLDGHCRQLFFSLNMRIFLCAFQIMFYLCNRKHNIQQHHVCHQDLLPFHGIACHRLSVPGAAGRCGLRLRCRRQPRRPPPRFRPAPAVAAPFAVCFP